VLVFVGGDTFTGDRGAPDLSREVQDQAMCFAARNGMIGVRVNYRFAPAATWPMGATDVAAALSWVHGNIDLFNGDAREIVAVGYGAGAFHVATLLAHPEFQTDRADVAAVVLVSGIYRAGKDASDSEKAYLGTDPTQYDKRSVFPGILNVDAPIVLAWAANDPANLVAQGETLKKTLCGAGHCPRSTLLRSRDGIAAAFGLDGSGDSLAEPTLLPIPRPNRNAARTREKVYTVAPNKRDRRRVQITSDDSAAKPDKAIVTYTGQVSVSSRSVARTSTGVSSTLFAEYGVTCAITMPRTATRMLMATATNVAITTS